MVPFSAAPLRTRANRPTSPWIRFVGAHFVPLGPLFPRIGMVGLAGVGASGA